MHKFAFILFNIIYYLKLNSVKWYGFLDVMRKALRISNEEGVYVLIKRIVMMFDDKTFLTPCITYKSEKAIS